jgi:hypothetical protein
MGPRPTMPSGEDGSPGPQLLEWLNDVLLGRVGGWAAGAAEEEKRWVS